MEVQMVRFPRLRAVLTASTLALTGLLAMAASVFAGGGAPPFPK
jgi:hypothetical protein